MIGLRVIKTYNILLYNHIHVNINMCRVSLYIENHFSIGYIFGLLSIMVGM